MDIAQHILSELELDESERKLTYPGVLEELELEDSEVAEGKLLNWIKKIRYQLTIESPASTTQSSSIPRPSSQSWPAKSRPYGG